MDATLPNFRHLETAFGAILNFCTIDNDICFFFVPVQRIFAQQMGEPKKKRKKTITIWTKVEEKKKHQLDQHSTNVYIYRSRVATKLHPHINIRIWKAEDMIRYDIEIKQNITLGEGKAGYWTVRLSQRSIDSLADTDRDLLSPAVRCAVLFAVEF